MAPSKRTCGGSKVLRNSPLLLPARAGSPEDRPTINNNRVRKLAVRVETKRFTAISGVLYLRQDSVNCRTCMFLTPASCYHNYGGKPGLSSLFGQISTHLSFFDKSGDFVSRLKSGDWRAFPCWKVGPGRLSFAAAGYGMICWAGRFALRRSRAGPARARNAKLRFLNQSFDNGLAGYILCTEGDE